GDVSSGALECRLDVTPPTEIPVGNLSETLDYRGTRTITSRMSAHAIGDSKHGGIRNEAVLVVSATAASIGRGRPSQGHRFTRTVGQRNGRSGGGLADLSHCWSLASGA